MVGQYRSAPKEPEPLPEGIAVLMVVHECVKCEAAQLVPMVIGADGLWYTDGEYVCGDCQSELRPTKEALKNLHLFDDED
jgi:hypothetical protein